MEEAEFHPANDSRKQPSDKGHARTSKFEIRDSQFQINRRITGICRKNPKSLMGRVRDWRKARMSKLEIRNKFESPSGRNDRKAPRLSPLPAGGERRERSVHCR